MGSKSGPRKSPDNDWLSISLDPEDALRGFMEVDPEAVRKAEKREKAKRKRARKRKAAKNKPKKKKRATKKKGPK